MKIAPLKWKKKKKTTLDTTLDIQVFLHSYIRVFAYWGIRLFGYSLTTFDFGQLKCDKHKVHPACLSACRIPADR